MVRTYPARARANRYYHVKSRGLGFQNFPIFILILEDALPIQMFHWRSCHRPLLVRLLEELELRERGHILEEALEREL